MHIERLVAVSGYCFDDGKTERDIRYEYTVHYIKMQPIGIAAVYHINSLGNVGKVSGK
jgi:hypothetical protein